MQIRRLAAPDHDAWLGLWRGYLEFYGEALADDVTERTWRRLVGEDRAVIGLGAIEDDELTGICHLVFHPSTWSPTDYCYLEDLFVEPSGRTRGAGRALIEAAAAEARDAGSTKLYWQTQSTNATARRLYDTVAENRGFIVYELDL